MDASGTVASITPTATAGIANLQSLDLWVRAGAIAFVLVGVALAAWGVWSKRQANRSEGFLRLAAFVALIGLSLYANTALVYLPVAIFMGALVVGKEFAQSLAAIVWNHKWALVGPGASHRGKSEAQETRSGAALHRSFRLHGLFGESAESRGKEPEPDFEAQALGALVSSGAFAPADLMAQMRLVRGDSTIQLDAVGKKGDRDYVIEVAQAADVSDAAVKVSRLSYAVSAYRDATGGADVQGLLLVPAGFIDARPPLTPDDVTIMSVGADGTLRTVG